MAGLTSSSMSLAAVRSWIWRSIVVLQIGSAIASLVLMSIGLAVIFGMMRVINLAQASS